MDNDLDLKWSNCIFFMKDNLSSLDEKSDLKKLGGSFDLLFDKVYPISFVEGNLTLSVPSSFYKEYIEDNYISILSLALKKYFGRGVKLWYAIGENGGEKNKENKYKGLSVQSPKPQKVIPTHLIGKNVENHFAIPGLKKIDIESNLNNSLSFDNFIEGESNRFAYTAAKTIANRPGQTSFNPLFIYGGVGVGKTHLIQAVGLEVKNKFPEKLVMYVPTEKFIQQFVNVATKNPEKRAEFANLYQMVDVLIIDDIQFLSGKKATQDTFFHIFDHLHQNGKQLVLTSDKAPVDIQDIEERIVSRFKWGLSVEIKSPDFVTRKNIITNKLHRDGIQLTEDMIDFLASEVKSNVRELIGVINSVIAHSMVYKSDLTLDLLKETINKIATNKDKTVSISSIQDVVCNYFGIQKEQLLSKTRKRDIALPRQLAMYFSKEYTNYTYARIGQEMGGKDHTTVMHAHKTIENFSKVDKEVKKYIKDLKEKIFA